MSVTSGFFNSVNSDRKYNAEQMSAIFDGVINDGIFANVGTAFTVTADTGFQVNVGIGRAWFNSKWILNDSILALTLDLPEVLLSRIDAIVIEIDNSDTVRAGSIKIVKGTPASVPQQPAMISTSSVHQYPLAYILVEPGVSSITQSKITSMIGTSSAPYVTGILQVQNIDNIVAQWGAQWVEWFTAEKALSESERQAIQDQWDAWFSGSTGDWNTWFSNTLTQWQTWFHTTTTEGESDLAALLYEMHNDFLVWFNALQDLLEPDVAATLANRILGLETAFDTLEKTKTIYSGLLDSNSSPILDSNGLEIDGKTVFLAENSVVADNIGYLNDASKLKAHTVQGAIDELANRKSVLVFHATAFASDWSEDTKLNVVSVIGLPEDVDIQIGISDEATDAEWTSASQGLIRGVEQGLETVTLKYLGSIPLIDLPILIYAWPKG